MRTRREAPWYAEMKADLTRPLRDTSAITTVRPAAVSSRRSSSRMAVATVVVSMTVLVAGTKPSKQLAE